MNEFSQHELRELCRWAVELEQADRAAGEELAFDVLVNHSSVKDHGFRRELAAVLGKSYKEFMDAIIKRVAERTLGKDFGPSARDARLVLVTSQKAGHGCTVRIPAGTLQEGRALVLALSLKVEVDAIPESRKPGSPD